MKAYVTKYCLSRGIYEADLHDPTTGDNSALYDRCWTRYEIGRDVALTREEAGAIATKMAQRKIASLQKSIAKMQALALSPKWL